MANLALTWCQDDRAYVNRTHSRQLGLNVNLKEIELGARWMRGLAGMRGKSVFDLGGFNPKAGE